MTPVVIAELIRTYIDKTRSGNLAQHSQNTSTRTGTGVMPGRNLVHTLSETREPNNAKKKAALKSVYKKIHDLQ